ncbi:MAG: ketopantoate reductase family protein [Salinigranum sp.]
MDVVVFGAGSLGSLVGGLLARAHDVTLVGRDPHVHAVVRDGLGVTGVESFVVRPEATADGTGLSADLAVVTVKAFDTAAAAEALATGGYGAALSLQNGMGNEDVLAERLDCPILAGTTTLGAVLSGPGAVEWRGRGEVVLGRWRGSDDRADATDRETGTAGTPPVEERVAAAFREAGVETTVAGDVRVPLWEKLAVNAAINPTTALARVDNGALASPAASDLVEPVTRETAAVARAEGVDLTDDDAIEAVRRVASATARNHSSMRQDVTAGRRTEIDAITGYVVDRAGRRGVAVPVNRTLFALVRTWEAERNLR